MTYLICTEDGEEFFELMDRKGFPIEFLEDERLFKIDNYSGVSFKLFEDVFRLRSYACDLNARSISMSPERLMQFVRCQVFRSRLRTIKPPKKIKAVDD